MSEDAIKFQIILAAAAHNVASRVVAYNLKPEIATIIAQFAIDFLMDIAPGGGFDADDFRKAYILALKDLYDVEKARLSVKSSQFIGMRKTRYSPYVH